MKFIVPVSLKREHQELHEALDQAVHVGGETGERAKEVVRLLHPHFLREEAFALPPLGLLTALVRGEISPEMRDVFAMTDRLKAELPDMENDHREIVIALQELSKAAREESKTDQEKLAEQIVFHARGEEEVSYPAAILVGEYLKLVIGP